MKSETDYKALAPGLYEALNEVRRMKDWARTGQYKAAYQQALVEVETYLAAMHQRAESGEYIHPRTRVES